MSKNSMTEKAQAVASKALEAAATAAAEIVISSVQKELKSEGSKPTAAVLQKAKKPARAKKREAPKPIKRKTAKKTAKKKARKRRL